MQQSYETNQLTTHLHEAHSLLEKTWIPIYTHHKDHPPDWDTFYNHYHEHLQAKPNPPRGPPTAEQLHQQALRASGKSAPGMDGWRPVAAFDPSLLG